MIIVFLRYEPSKNGQEYVHSNLLNHNNDIDMKNILNNTCSCCKTCAGFCDKGQRMMSYGIR
jgi:hypothetical protein